MRYRRALPILTAPTAAGKTATALRLARDYPLEIVSADAFTVYRGLDIGTAKPTVGERAAVPHYLLDVVEVHEPFDVAQWLSLAEQAISDILNRDKLPLIVGGTGFYLSALTRGLPLTPPSLPQGRAWIEAELQARGLDALLAEIAARNPAEARRMERNPRRVVRALEIYRRTGQFPGEFGYTQPAHRYEIFAFTRPDLQERISTRVNAMLDIGWPEEAAWLAAQVNPTQIPQPTVWQALGYREALALAEDRSSREQTAESITLHTRQYAKRQLTWARTQLGAAIRTPEDVEAALHTFLSLAR